MKLTKQKTFPQLKRKLDKVFSEYIRKRDMNKPCISCGKYGEKDAGHYHTRSMLSVRWNEVNVNGQCKYCNRFLEGNKEGYRQGIIERHGQEALDLLNIKARYRGKLYRADLQLLIDFYKQKLEGL